MGRPKKYNEDGTLIDNSGIEDNSGSDEKEITKELKFDKQLFAKEFVPPFQVSWFNRYLKILDSKNREFIDIRLNSNAMDYTERQQQIAGYLMQLLNLQTIGSFEDELNPDSEDKKKRNSEIKDFFDARGTTNAVAIAECANRFRLPEVIVKALAKTFKF